MNIQVSNMEEAADSKTASTPVTKTTVAKKPMAKKKQILRWDHDANEYLIVALAETLKEERVKVPWDQVAKKMGSDTKANSVTSHISKLKSDRLEAGKIVPPGPYLNPDAAPKPKTQSITSNSKSAAGAGVAKAAPRRLVSKRKKQYKDISSDESSDEYDPAKGDPEASYSKKSGKTKRIGPANKAVKHSSPKALSNDSDEKGLTGSVKSEASRHNMFKIKCDPEALKKALVKVDCGVGHTSRGFQEGRDQPVGPGQKTIAIKEESKSESVKSEHPNSDKAKSDRASSQESEPDDTSDEKTESEEGQSGKNKGAHEEESEKDHSKQVQPEKAKSTDLGAPMNSPVEHKIEVVNTQMNSARENSINMSEVLGGGVLLYSAQQEVSYPLAVQNPGVSVAGTNFDSEFAVTTELNMSPLVPEPEPLPSSYIDDDEMNLWGSSMDGTSFLDPNWMDQFVHTEYFE